MAAQDGGPVTGYSSSVPAAIAGLVAAFRTSLLLGVAGVPVRYGPELTQASGSEAVAVAYTGNQDEDVVTGTASPEGLAVLPDRERYAVMCAIEVIDPGSDIPAAVTRAYALHAACGAAIAVDHTLGKAVLRASAGIGSLQLQQPSNGALAHPDAPAAARPSACKGVPDATVRTFAAEIMASG